MQLVSALIRVLCLDILRLAVLYVGLCLAGVGYDVDKLSDTAASSAAACND